MLLLKEILGGGMILLLLLLLFSSTDVHKGKLKQCCMNFPLKTISSKRKLQFSADINLTLVLSTGKVSFFSFAAVKCYGYLKARLFLMIKLANHNMDFLTSPLALAMGELRMKSGGAKTSTRATASSFSCLKRENMHLATSVVVCGYLWTREWHKDYFHKEPGIVNLKDIHARSRDLLCFFISFWQGNCQETKF